MNRTKIIALLLILATVAVYGQAVTFGFVDYDDPIYVLDSDEIHRGLTKENIKWALLYSHSANWHPVTTISHILDWQIFGSSSGGHHAINVLLHTLSVVLLFVLMKYMTGRIWPSAFVAAVFALHPLHVESVAWISERKDVLSAFFAFSTLYAYATYARHPSIAKYIITLALFVIGLMCKPMLVTLPFVFLLFDYWPLQRVELGHYSKADESAVACPHRSAMILLVEKIPFFVLVLFSCVITFQMQKHGDAIRSGDLIPVAARLANSLVAYVQYISMAIWPAGLAVLYPHPDQIGGTPLTSWKILGAGLFLVGVTAWAISSIRRRYATVGWLLYLGMLVPVIGIIQVGVQAYADRYMYLPIIGLSIVVAWGVPDAINRLRNHQEQLRTSVIVIAGIVVIAMGITAFRQARLWRDSIPLFTHTLEVTSANPVMHATLGSAYVREHGQYSEALYHYRKALAIQPHYERAQKNLASTLFLAKQYPEAIEQFEVFFAMDPIDAEARFHYATALTEQNQLEQAIGQYDLVLRLNPENNPKVSKHQVYNRLAWALDKSGRPDEAISYLHRAVTEDPAYADGWVNLGNMLSRQGRLGEAFRAYQLAIEKVPDHINAHFTLAKMFMQIGPPPKAMHHFKRTIELDPQHAEAWFNLGNLYSQAGKPYEAITAYEEAIKITPVHSQAETNLAWQYMRVDRSDAALEHFAKAHELQRHDPTPLNGWAWVLATDEHPKIRDPHKAIEKAEMADALTRHRDPVVLDTLSAAYASAGRFDQAIPTAQLALAYAAEQADDDLVARVLGHIKLYRQNKPYIEIGLQKKATGAPQP